MANQVVAADQWIVVDDGRVPCAWILKPRNLLDYVTRAPRVGDEPTLNANLREAIQRVKGTRVVIIEDDEYYAPDYIAQMNIRLNNFEVVGLCRTRYYHIPSGGYFVHSNLRHASLAETAFRQDFLATFATFLTADVRPFLDTRLWGAIIHERSRAHLFTDSEIHPLYLGIKGLSGRAGIGVGHSADRYRQFDTTRGVLKRWVPRDFSIYLDIIEGRLTEQNFQSVLGA
jgi:hypothetical protein